MNKNMKIITLSFVAALILNPLNANALTKSETVYGTLKYNGDVKKTTINTKLSDIEKGNVEDYTKLTNIKNINGKEEFSIESKKITWQSNGKDIYYQGKLNEELPVKVEAEYYLNGNKTTPKKMKNKSGNVKMIFKFVNNSYDKDSNMYTPFVVSTSTIINTKDNSNINVTNGKVVETGNKNVVTGISAPGLYESTKIDSFKNIDEIEISYDTKKFSMNEVYFIITPKLLNEADLEKLDKVDSLNSSLSLLSNGMNTVKDGSKKLSDGVKSAYDGSNNVSAGAEKLNNGLNQLNSGIEKALNGAEDISNGLGQVQNGSSKLSSLTTLVDTLYTKYNENNQKIVSVSSTKTDLENKLALKSQLELLEQAGTINPEQNAILTGLRAKQEEIETGIKNCNDGLNQLSGANQAISQVLIGVLGVDSMDNVNDTTITMFKGQMNSLLSGIGMLNDGANSLKNGLGDAKDGSSKLVNGSLELVNGSKKLTSGLEELYNGSNNLYDGIDKINNEGISKISTYGNKAVSYKNKIKQLIKLSKNYKGYSSDNSDRVVFVYKIDRS